MKTGRPRSGAAGLLALLLGVVSCVPPTTQGALQVQDAWIRPAAGGALSALYFRVENPGSLGDRLLEVETPAAASAEIHQSMADGDTMSMERRLEVELPPGERVVFEPGGLHVMLIGLINTIQPGDRVPVILTFERAGEVRIEASVREP